VTEPAQRDWITRSWVPVKRDKNRPTVETEDDPVGTPPNSAIDEMEQLWRWTDEDNRQFAEMERRARERDEE